MKRYLLPVAFLFTLATRAQTVYIPDQNFLIALMYEGVDQDLDLEITTEEAEAVETLNLSNNPLIQITDLTGIEAFTNLTSLTCKNHKLTALDISKNTHLNYLDCSSNMISFLDVSKNLDLAVLYCYTNLISRLDVSKNADLVYFSCDNNKLTSLNLSNNPSLLLLGCSINFLPSLDVSKNIGLQYLVCGTNRFTQLDVRNNPDIDTLSCRLEPSLNNCGTKAGRKALGADSIYCGSVSINQICIAKDQIAKSTYWHKDPTATWNSSCVVTSLNSNAPTKLERTMVRIYDLQGNVVPEYQAKRGLFIYEYSDGSKQKVYNQQ